MVELDRSREIPHPFLDAASKAALTLVESIGRRRKSRCRRAVDACSGDLTGNEELKREGERDETKGKVAGAVEDVKGAVREAGQAIDDAAK